MGRQHRIDRDLLLKAIGSKPKLPPDFKGIFKNVPVHSCYRYDLDSWETFTIIVRPAIPGSQLMSSYWKHRVLYACKCGNLMPIGRSQHHMGTSACKSLASTVGLANDAPWYAILDKLKESGESGWAEWWEWYYDPTPRDKELMRPTISRWR